MCRFEYHIIAVLGGAHILDGAVIRNVYNLQGICRAAKMNGNKKSYRKVIGYLLLSSFVNEVNIISSAKNALKAFTEYISEIEAYIRRCNVLEVKHVGFYNSVFALHTKHEGAVGVKNLVLILKSKNRKSCRHGSNFVVV